MWTSIHQGQGGYSRCWVFRLPSRSPSLSAALRQSYHPWTYRMPYPSWWHSHSIAYDQGHQYFTAHEMQWNHAHGIPWCYYDHHCLETTDLVEWWGNLLRTQWWHQLGCGISWGWDGVLQDRAYVLTQHPVFGTTSLIPRILISRVQKPWDATMGSAC